MFSSKVIVAGGYAGSVRLVDASSGASLHSFDGGGAAAGHINKLAESAGSLAAAGHAGIRIYDIESMKGSFVRQLEGHTRNVTSLAFERLGKWMVSSGEDGNVFIWDVRAKGYQMSLSHQGGSILCGVVHPGNGLYVFGDEEGFLNEWDLAACKMVRHNSCPNEYTGLGVSQVQIDPSNNNYFVCHTNNHVSVFPKPPQSNLEIMHSLESSTTTEDDDDDDDSSPTHALSPPTPLANPLISTRSLSTFRLTPNSTTFLNHRNPDIIVNSAKLDPAQTFANDVHSWHYVTSMRLLANKSIALTASDGSLSVWNSANDSAMWKLDCILREGVDDRPTAPLYWCWDVADLSNDNRFIVSAYSDGTCKIWDTSRPAGLPVASYDCGDGKCVKSVIVLDKSKSDSPIFHRRRR